MNLFVRYSAREKETEMIFEVKESSDTEIIKELFVEYSHIKVRKAVLFLSIRN